MQGSVVCFSLGSNLGDRISSLERATGLLTERVGDYISISGMYESPSWGYQSDRPFLNLCISIRTAFAPLELLELVLAIENEMGRIREGNKYSDRVIDLDILLYGDRVIEHPRLTVPHPRMNKRRFVLLPLAEIVPEMIHPVTGLSISELLDRCPDKSIVTPL